MLGPEDNKSPYVTGTLLSAIVHGDGIPMIAADSRGPEDNKSKTLSPYVTTGTTEVTLSYWAGILVVSCKAGIPMARCMAMCKDVIHMAGDTQGLKDNKSSNKDDLRTDLTTDLTALNYDDLARSLMARFGDVIPMARCGDVIPMARCMAMCKDVIRMAGDTQVHRDDLFPLRTYYKDLARSTLARCVDVIPMAGDTPGATRHGDRIRMAAADSRGLEDNKSRTFSPYYWTTGTTLVSLPYMPYRGRILMKADSRVSVQVSSMESLPSDVVQDILSRVPAESVLDCKFVCKKWKTLIRQSNFAKMHLSRVLNHLHGGKDDGNHNIASKVESSIIFACEIDDPNDYKVLLFHGGQLSDKIDEKYIYNQNLKRIYHPPMHNEPGWNQLVGSCNGLVCMLQHHNLVMDPIYICNPLTREYVYLPQLVVKKEVVANPGRIREGEVSMYGFTACGFGYVRSTSEYKVVRIHYIDYKGGIVEVYTLGGGCGWRAIGRVPYNLNTSSGGRGTYVNDAIYWTAFNKIVAFDLAKEEFRSLSVPPRLENRRREDICGLVALGRHLCLYMDDRLHVEILSLAEGSNLKETWCMEFDINYEAIAGSPISELRPLVLTENGEIILLYAESVLYSYDKKTALLKMICNGASSTNCFADVDGVAHVKTFASLEAMGENSKRYTVRSHRGRTPWDNVVDELDRVALGEEIDTTRFRLR